MRAFLNALGNQGRMLQAVIDNMPAGVFMVEAPSGRPVLTNRRAETMLGRGISPEAIGDELNIIYRAYRAGTSEFYPSQEMPIVAGLHGQARTVDDLEVRRPDGSRILLEVNGAPVLDAKGNVVASIVVFQDITERRRAEQELRAHRERLEQLVVERTAELTRANEELRQEIAERAAAEQALRESEARFRAVIEQAGDVIILSDLSGRIISFNRTASESLGWPAEELLGMSMTDIDAQHSESRAAEVSRTAFEEGSVLFETVLRRKDGSTFPVEVRCTIIEQGGQKLVFGLARDITIRRRTQELLIQSEKMLTVGGLAAGIAHEINNPLAAIVQNAQVVLNRTSPDLANNQRIAGQCGTSIDAITAYMEHRGLREMLQTIRESGERAAVILKNMLGFSRGGGPASMRPHDLRTLLDQTIELAGSDYDLTHKHDFRRIEIVRDYAELLPVCCDAAEIQQVFFNLLKNAAEAMSGNPADAPPRLRLRLVRRGKSARIEVQDNGPGMPEPVRQRIFEPFFTTKPPGAGTGLGLFVCYYIITRIHGGTMNVESSLGRGTTFTITLPLAREEESCRSAS